MFTDRRGGRSVTHSRWDMHKFFSVAALAAVSMLLGACGGSSFQSSSSGSGGGSSAVASLAVTSDVATIPSDGSSGATITVVAKDANNNAVSGATISFAANNGGNVTATQGTTDTTGTAKGTLVVGTATAGATITVTASAGGVSGKTTLTVSNTQKTLTLLTSSPQIPSDNSKGATISAIVKDANNNLLAGVPVSFQVDSGAVAAVATTGGVAPGTTDSTGLAQALVTTPGDPTNRTITVKAAAGTATAQLSVAVGGTSLTLSGPTNLVLNNNGPFTTVLTNSSGQGIPNTAVSVSSANNNTLSATSLVTDATGRATFTVKGVAGGNDTITATALGITQKTSLAVSTQSFSFSAPADGTTVNLGSSQQLTVTWTNSGAPVVGQTVSVVATRGTVTPITPVTDANGKAVFSISSTSGGPSIVQASGTGVSSQLNLQFVALNPSQVAIQAGPTAVPTQGQSTLTATVRDAQNNLVQGATVDFQVVTDPTNGGLSTASAVTDAQGRAQTVYTAGNTSSGANGVSVSATVHSTSITATTSLTVGGQAIGLSFGTGNTIDVTKGSAIYQVVYSVLAVDSHGAPLPNQPITFSVLPVAYGKGSMAGCPGGTRWVPTYNTLAADTYAYSGPGLLGSAQMCRNEDTDYTGNIASLDGSTPGTCTNLLTNKTIAAHAKDYNCNATLDPGSVATVSPSQGTTDATGRLDVAITYPRDHAYWTMVSLIATTTVQGTQSSTSTTFTLQGESTDYSCSTGPPGPVSPYGQAATCSNPN